MNNYFTKGLVAGCKGEIIIGIDEVKSLRDKADKDSTEYEYWNGFLMALLALDEEGLCA